MKICFGLKFVAVFIVIFQVDFGYLKFILLLVNDFYWLVIRKLYLAKDYSILPPLHFNFAKLSIHIKIFQKEQKDLFYCYTLYHVCICSIFFLHAFKKQDLNEAVMVLHVKDYCFVSYCCFIYFIVIVIIIF